MLLTSSKLPLAKMWDCVYTQHDALVEIPVDTTYQLGGFIFTKSSPCE
jgi:hypothetical protein